MKKKTNPLIRKATINNVLLMLVVVFAVSCKPTLKVTSDYNRSADFYSYKTFSIYRLDITGRVNQLNEERIIKSIRSEMIKKGFRENNSHPDLMVNAVTVLRDKKSLYATTNYYGYGGSYRPYGYWNIPAAGSVSVNTHNYKEGSLMIDVVDAKTNKLVWEGSGYADIEKQPKNPDEIISKAVAKIMNTFPVILNIK